MDKAFLETLGLEAEQAEQVLRKVQEALLYERLQAEGVRSTEAAKAVLDTHMESDYTTDAAVRYLKAEHGYLFESTRSVFTGPVDGGVTDADDAVRKALGIEQ